ncbi:MAG: 4Fe-4S binding protein [Clostridiales bacterium]|nr:4Fe-4S binding protein [Clostridiales bacterium]
MICTVPESDVKRVKGMGFLRDKTTPDCFNCRVITRNGKITTEECIAIAKAAKLYGNGEVAMTIRQAIEIQKIPYGNIDPLIAYLAEYGLEPGGTGPKVRPIVSCKGTTCNFGLVDTFDLSKKIHYSFYKGYRSVKLPHKFKIAVGGCPNNCVKPDTNDLGIVGQRVVKIDIEKCKGCKLCQIEKVCPIKAAKLVEGKLVIDRQECNNCGRCVDKCPFHALDEYTDGYTVYIGGMWGKKTAKGQRLGKIFESEEEVLSVVEKSILLYKEKGIQGERFNDTIRRLGFENVESQLISNDILARKDKIING